MTGSTATLRERALHARNAMSAEDCRRRSASITDTLYDILNQTGGETVALYCAVRNEVNVTPLLERLPALQFGFPVIDSNRDLQFYKARTVGDLVVGKYGIPAPCLESAQYLQPANIDAVVVPVVAFDTLCNRIGMGGGYYDRTLAGWRNATFIGVAYETQRCERIKPQSWDIPMHQIVTDKHVYERTYDAKKR
ncbi:MAG: 5-formyltetrahydrofolate cyclo-ligase [Pseudomonadota bacterium]